MGAKLVPAKLLLNFPSEMLDSSVAARAAGEEPKKRLSRILIENSMFHSHIMYFLLLFHKSKLVLYVTNNSVMHVPLEYEP